MDVTISPAMCFGGRELTEPTLDPTGRWLAYAVRSGSARAIVTVDLDADRPLERQLTTSPPPATGRAPGGGCFAWRPDGSGIVYAAVDGGLWHQPVPGGAATCLVPGVEGSAVAGPAVAADGSFVVFERDQAGVWAVPFDGGEPNRLDGGDDEFCLDPAVSPDGRRVAWIAWSPPDMPWDGAALVVADRATGERTRDRLADGAWQQPRFAADGTLAGVHDGTGWLNVRLGDRSRGARAVRAGRPDVGAGPAVLRRRAVGPPRRLRPQRGGLRPAGRRRRVDGRARRRRPGRPLVAVVARPPARRAAHRCADTDRGRGVRHDDVGADRRRRRAGPGLGRRRPGRARAGAGDGGRRCRAARPAVPQPAPERTAAVLGARRPDEPVGGRVRAPAGVLGRPGLEPARPRSPRVDRPRARVPAGAARTLGRARRRRHRHAAGPGPAARGRTAGDDGRRRWLGRRHGGARDADRRGGGARGRWRRRLPGHRPRRAGRSQPSLRGPLHRHPGRAPRARRTCCGPARRRLGRRWWPGRCC